MSSSKRQPHFAAFALGKKTATNGRLLMVAALIASALSAAACIPLAATGIALGAMAVIDRRTIGAQTEDQAIEIKAVKELRKVVSDYSGIDVTSYNRRVLLTGQVVSDVDKQNSGAAIAGLPNVRGVYNELEIATNASLGMRANDTTLTTKVKTALLRDEQVPGNSVKVKSESGVVYLLGLLTNSEAQRAAELTSQVAGVARVVTVFEIISNEDAQRLSTDPTAAPPAQQPQQPQLVPQGTAPAQSVAPPTAPAQSGSGQLQQAPATSQTAPVNSPPQTGFQAVPAAAPGVDVQTPASQPPLVAPRQ